MNTPTDRYQNALAFLSDHQDIEREETDEGTPAFDLDAMRSAVSGIGQPERGVPMIHVAGTKGKGSVCLMLEAFLFGAGYTPGVFVSPHLIELRERLRLNREPVTQEAFCDLLDSVRSQLSDVLPEAGDELTYFEWLTLMAFELFQGEQVEVGVLEVGMGGRLDSTNVITPDLTVITSIGLDHEKFLGNSISEIAAEKAGIIKPDVPVVTTAGEDQGLDVILDRADEQNAPAYVLGRDFSIVDRIPQGGSGTGQKVVLELANSDRLDLHLSVPGRPQAENLAGAVQAAFLFVQQQNGLWNPGIVGSAARQLYLPGRFQIHRRRPPVILDAAHNPLSCRALLSALKETGFSTPRTLLFGTAADKKWRNMIDILAPAFDHAMFTGYDHPRSEDPERIRSWCQDAHPDLHPETCASPVEQVRTHIEEADSEHPLVVAGSFYLVGQILKTLGHRSDEETEEADAEGGGMMP
jgi:dihydrofolate synthase/folylpolyglutamate synthase